MGMDVVLPALLSQTLTALSLTARFLFARRNAVFFLKRPKMKNVTMGTKIMEMGAALLAQLKIFTPAIIKTDMSLTAKRYARTICTMKTRMRSVMTITMLTEMGAVLLVR